MDVLTASKTSAASSTPGSAIEPAHLYFSFSTAADRQKIHDALKPEVRAEFDPNGFVKPRRADKVDEAIEEGRVAFAQDQTGRVHALSFAYRYAGEHAFTEIGTVMSRLRGWRAGHLVVAAQALREKFYGAHDHTIVAKVAPENARAINFFGNDLQWDRVRKLPRAMRFFTIVSGTRIKDWPSRAWFEAGENAVQAQCDIVRSASHNGGLQNRDGRVIPVEMDSNVTLG